MFWVLLCLLFTGLGFPNIIIIVNIIVIILIAGARICTAAKAVLWHFGLRFSSSGAPHLHSHLLETFLKFKLDYQFSHIPKLYITSRTRLQDAQINL
jgi:hypothetical protein